MTTGPTELRWPTYPARGVTLESAAVSTDTPERGALRVRDSAGKVYLDAIAGIGSAALGHAHPRWVEAVSAQLGRLSAVANTFWHAPAQQLAARLRALFPLDDARSFFCNSGAEATEAAIKLALRATGRPLIVAFERAFHGRTLGAISLTANPKYRDPFVRCPDDDVGESGDARFAEMKVLRLPFDDRAALEGVFTQHGSRIAAVFLEPIQGEGGVWPASAEFLLAARRLCDEHGALLGVDEIQSGCGRTGRWTAWESIVGDAAQPDIVWLAKALGGSFPIGACLASARLAEYMGPGTHGTTFGGNPVACAAALATLEIIEDEQLLASAAAQLPTLARIREQQPIPEVRELRGAGAMIGIQLGGLEDGRARQIAPALMERGVLVTTPGGHTVRLLLPYAAGEAELREIWSAVADACAATPV